jgi:ribonuclease HI
LNVEWLPSFGPEYIRHRGGEITSMQPGLIEKPVLDNGRTSGQRYFSGPAGSFQDQEPRFGRGGHGDSGADTPAPVMELGKLFSKNILVEFICRGNPMIASVAWKIHIDGAARGNPGPAAYAFILEREGSPAQKQKGFLGTMTNNLAEYTALVRALERARELGAQRLIVYSDSELLVKQMNGEYRVKNPDLRVLYDRAQELSRHFEQVIIRHVPRERNSLADQLCNEALDEATLEKKNRGPESRADEFDGRRRDRNQDHASQAIREMAIRQLRSAAASWAKGDAESPDPEAVWDQLWRMLEETGLVLPLEEDD